MLRPPLSSSSHGSMSDHPRDDATPGLTRDDARRSNPHQASKHRHPSDSSAMEPPQSVKRLCYATNLNWSQRDDQVLCDSIMRGGSLHEAMEELKSSGRERSYEACKMRWHRRLRPITRTNEQTVPWDNDSTYSPPSAPPVRRRKRGNLSREWHAEEDAVLLREYTGDDTDWEAVAAELVNGLYRVPRLLTPRTATSCKTRWKRLSRESDNESEDSKEGKQDGDCDLSITLKRPQTLTNLGDKGVPHPGPTSMTGGSQHGQEELSDVFCIPKIRSQTYSPTVPVRPSHVLHSPPRPSRPQLPTGLPDVHAANSTATVAAQSGLPSMDERAQQTDTLRHDVERPTSPPIDLTVLEPVTRETVFTPPDLLPLDGLSQYAPQPGAEPRQLGANQPKIDPMLLERAVSESKAIKPSTSMAVCRIVARQMQRKYGIAEGQMEKLMDNISKELDTGCHRSTVIAIRYKELSGHDISPEIFETAENDVQSAQTSTAAGASDRMLLFCMCILWANPTPGQEKAESLMDEVEKMRRRESEVRAGKGKWHCIAAYYRQLASKASAKSGDKNTVPMGDRANVR